MKETPTSNRPLQLLTFASVALGAYLLLVFVGDADAARRTFTDNVKEPLKAILAAATASAAALLVPAIKKPPKETRPSAPDPTPIPTTNNEPTVPLSAYNRILEEVEQWRLYGSDMKAYTTKVESLCSLLDTRQAVLRVSAYAILALAFFLAAAGFLAPSISIQPGVALQDSLLISHFLYLAAAIAFGGFMIGVIIYRIHVRTAAWHARRSALVATLLLNLSAFLISLPYVFPRMWNQPVSICNIALPLLVWLALFRLVVSPVICMVFAYLGFYSARWSGRRQPSTTNV